MCSGSRLGYQGKLLFLIVHFTQKGRLKLHLFLKRDISSTIRDRSSTTTKLNILKYYHERCLLQCQSSGFQF